MVAQVTGGTPKTTGIYYDDSYKRALLPAGTTNCAGAKPGTEVTYFEQMDKDQTALDAGQGLAGPPPGPVHPGDPQPRRRGRRRLWSRSPSTTTPCCCG